MKLLDYWVLYLYHFVCFFKKDDLAWFSARLYLSIFMFTFIMNVLNVVCIIMNKLSINEEFIEFVRLGFMPIWLVLYILCGIVINIYYWKGDNIHRIETSYSLLSKEQRWVVKFFVYFLEIILPVSLFISTRLVLFGQVKWW